VKTPQKVYNECMLGSHGETFDLCSHFSFAFSPLPFRNYDRQRQRNREHARRSRLRKKNKTHDLEQSIEDLKKENKKLRKQAYAIRKKEDVDLVLQRARSVSTNRAQKFLTSLKRQENRIMSPETISFLETLRINAWDKATKKKRSNKSS
jgi:bZIP transcription factor